MCGIAGYLCLRGLSDDTRTILRMSRRLAHRGPDDEGFLLIDRGAAEMTPAVSSQTAPGAPRGVNIEQGPKVLHDVALAHRRFSIMEVSAAGHQPMIAADGQTAVIFNGEIYNHAELRRELQSLGRSFRGGSDTEVMLQAWEQWGEKCLRRFVGFWAAAIYERSTRRLTLSRDRLGKAPLYLMRTGERLYFASEIRAILDAAGRGALAVEEQCIADYALLGRRDLDERTFFRGVMSLPAASAAEVNGDGTLNVRRFWQLPTRRMTESELPADEAVARFNDTLADAVDLRLRADVPVGMELSGGLDSSTMVALTAGRGEKLRAFTASFQGEHADEAPFARQVVERYKDTAELETVTPSDGSFWDEADEFIDLMHEPIHAVNVFTYQQVWRAMAARGLRVSVSGAAADELLAGYHRDYYLPYLRRLMVTGEWGRLHRECAALSERPVEPWSRDYFRRLWQAARGEDARSNGTLAVSSPGSGIHRLERRLSPLRLNAEPRELGGEDVDELLHRYMTHGRMSQWLRVGHQSAMGVPLEVRMPFLDHRVVELGFTLPLSYLIRDGWMKWIMRKAMDGRLPDEINWRRKKWGFRFPFSQWLSASEARFWNAAGNVDCPYVDSGRLRSVYQELAQVNPLLLWRTINLVLWWKRCVLGERLSPGEAASRKAVTR